MNHTHIEDSHNLTAEQKKRVLTCGCNGTADIDYGGTGKLMLQVGFNAWRSNELAQSKDACEQRECRTINKSKHLY